MNIAIVAVGPPGTGKTTLLRPLAERYGFAYINRDDIRQELLGDATDQSANEAVWEEANRRTANALESGIGVVLDSTFVEPWKRVEAIQFLRANGATHIIGVVSNVTLEDAMSRNAARERVVPLAVLEDLFRKHVQNPPTLAEGFDLLLPL